MTDQRRAGGFTLMEILVVVVVMGLLLTLVIARGPQHSPTLDLRDVASRVAQAMRLARTQAIATDRPVHFLVDPARRTFGTDGAMQPVPRGIAIAAPARAIVFEPDGSATSGAIALAIRQMRMIVSVNWLNGRVSVEQTSAS